MVPKNTSLMLIFLGSCLGVASPAWAKGPNLTSAYVNVDKCPGGDATRNCAPYEGYKVIETRSPMSDFRLVVMEEEGFQTFLEPGECQEAHHEPAMEWRLYDGQPFAVIQRVNCYRPIEQEKVGKGARKPESVYVVVRGLKGFEGLRHELKLSGRADVNKKARLVADAFLERQWPRLQKERLEKERLRDEKLADEGDDPEFQGEAGPDGAGEAVERE